MEEFVVYVEEIRHILVMVLRYGIDIKMEMGTILENGHAIIVMERKKGINLGNLNVDYVEAMKLDSQMASLYG